MMSKTMQNEVKVEALESVTPNAKEHYELNLELVSATVQAVVDQLELEGVGRSELIDCDYGCERLRDLVWEYPGELGVLERCLVLERVLHVFGERH